MTGTLDSCRIKEELIDVGPIVLQPPDYYFAGRKRKKKQPILSKIKAEVEPLKKTRVSEETIIKKFLASCQNDRLVLKDLRVVLNRIDPNNTMKRSNPVAALSCHSNQNNDKSSKSRDLTGYMTLKVKYIPPKIKEEPVETNQDDSRITLKVKFRDIKKEPIEDPLDIEDMATENITCSEDQYEKHNAAQQLKEELPTIKEEDSVQSGNCNRTFVNKYGLIKHLNRSCKVAPKRQTVDTDLIDKKRDVKVSMVRCPQCNVVVENKMRLYHHMKEHKEDRPHKCDLCPATFTTRKYYTAHRNKVHNSTRRYECDYCGSSHKRKYALTMHIHRHTNLRPYKCSFCDARFNQLYTLKVHKRKHTGEKPYVCEICQKRFHDRPSMNKHVKYHKGARDKMCPYCPKSFVIIRDLKYHLLVHSLSKPFHCDTCKMKFYKKEQLKKHIQTVHVAHNGRPYQCNVCESYFSHQGLLTKHLKIHPKAKYYKCMECPATFGNKTVLAKHTRSHKVKTHKCAMCSLTFKKMFVRDNHERSHVENVKYSCEDCEMKFTSEIRFMRHISTH